MSNKLKDLRTDLCAYLVGNTNLPEFVAENVLLGNSQESPEDFDQRRANAMAKAKHGLGIVLYEGSITNDDDGGDLNLVSQHIIEFYRSPARHARQAATTRSSEALLLSLIQNLHGFRSNGNNAALHCNFDLRFVSATPIADPHYEAFILLFNCHLDLPALDF